MVSILVATVVERPALAIRLEAEAGELAQALDAALPALLDHLQALGEEGAGKPFLRYLGFTDAGRMMVEAGVETRSAMPSGAGVESLVLPGGEAAIADVRGDSAEVARAHEMLDRWMEKSGRAPAGAREELHMEAHGGWRHVRLIQPLAPD